MDTGRLSIELAKALAMTIETDLAPLSGAKLYLFGSRADQSKKGGDIDLLLLASQEVVLRAQKLKLELKAHLREAAGDQRVDLVCATVEELQTSSFLKSIWSEASTPPLLLKEWP